ncbi:hypothetical protein ASE00_13775 [Sphingomonas sp. Root710]|uniref:lytic transglycosylase domain-containing protein n=1 Tax=Sphingomonas sp. Root710 TaxID=1736594 RepID=UPI0006F2F43A|nr:lytic transglycosylase domain-containing protein [Sphingomonas sp. Root710]KRB81083.1 hypothetical protein ASE00_13775 [Sphingomonas sp. Root710]
MIGGLRSAAGAIALFTTAFPVAAQPAPSAAANGCATHAAEAANRSGLPIDVVLRVMMAESASNPRIVSPKGAMGCMQIMPATWAYLTARYRLGPDPFDARMNMIGGAMYLAELTNRYGAAGAIAAYNAGPGRYERYAKGAVPLPAETIAYVARIGASRSAPGVPPMVARWQDASLFMKRSMTAGDHGAAAAASSPPTVSLFPLAGFDKQVAPSDR